MASNPIRWAHSSGWLERRSYMACSNTTGSKTAVGLEFKSPWAHFKFSVPGFPFPDDGGSEFFLSNFSEFKNLRFWAPTKLLSGFLIMFFTSFLDICS